MVSLHNINCFQLRICQIVANDTAVVMPWSPGFREKLRRMTKIRKNHKIWKLQQKAEEGFLKICRELDVKSLQGTFNGLWSRLSHRLPGGRLLSCPLQCLCVARSVSRTVTKRFTAHRPEETICCLRARSICCCHFYYLWLEEGGDFSLDHFNILCLWLYWNCANKFCVSLTQMLRLDKIFRTVSSTVFFHMRCYS